MTRTRALVITGAPGVGKSTVAGLLVTRLARGAHIEADELHRMIVTGRVWPSAATEEAYRQLLVRTRNAAQIAANFLDADITPIIDEVVASEDQVAILDEALGHERVSFVVLAAPVETVLARDGVRTKQTAANYLGVDAMVGLTLRERATTIVSGDQTPDQTATAVQAATELPWTA